MKKILLLIASTLCFNLLWSQTSKNIITRQDATVDTFYNNYIIKDPYRWLEDVNSEETKDWVANQNKQSSRFLSKCSAKTKSYQSIDKYNTTKFKNPQKMGKYYFRYAYYNHVGSPALYYQEKLKEDPRILVDPNFISSKDEIMLKGYYLSKDSKYLAYQFSRNGSDWAELKIITLPNRINKKDHLTGLKFSQIAWLKDGFFYSVYQQDNKFGETKGQQVYYHKVGTEQSDDKLIFFRKNPSIQFSYQTTSNERYFVLRETDEDAGKINIFYIDYQSENPHITPLITNLKDGIRILGSHDGKFIAQTSHNANNGSIVEIDPANPYKWNVIVPEFSESLLLKTMLFNDRIVTIYQSNQHPILAVYSYTGKMLYNLEFPVATSISGFEGNPNDEDLLFRFGSYTIPPVLYKFNLKTFKRKLTEQTAVTFDFNDIEYKEVEYKTNDTVAVSMTLVYEKGIKLDGTNPTILKAYGGFGIVAQPSFDPGIVYFIKHGGIFAFANIRGGGDKGSDWANAGRGDDKQNSFDDFIAAAKYLIQNKYTSPEKLAATGASNGGLVVAASAIERPDLFKAVVPIVAPLDMLRFEKFTVGHWYTDEYGTVTDSLSFTKLLAYSPYHNIQDSINYPAMMVLTSENDDRVPPFHSYKFVAKLQSREAQTNPILLKVEKDAGHYGAQSLSSNIRQMADIYGFIAFELGVF